MRIVVAVPARLESSRLPGKILEKIGGKLSKLSKKQADYIGVNTKGPFKSENYRY